MAETYSEKKIFQRIIDSLMEKKPEQIHPDEWLKDSIPLQTQPEGFKPEEMLACPKCNRRSAPNRLKCFYCDTELPISDSNLIKPNFRSLDIWEPGFNIIISPDNSDFRKINFVEIAQFLQLESADLENVFLSKKTLPIVRVESEKEAEIIVNRLKDMKAESFVLSDSKLEIETPPRRLRGMGFSDDKLKLILFNTDEIIEIGCEDLCLIVSGIFFQRKIQSIEKHNRKKENKILDASEISSDKLFIDIYIRNDSTGFRIETKGFDFSSLGAEKQLIAAENIKKVSEKLRLWSPKAKYDEDYKFVRCQLNRVWKVEEKRDSKGVQRKSFGGIQLESVVTVNNLSQFNKYSRLQRHLL